MIVNGILRHLPLCGRSSSRVTLRRYVVVIVVLLAANTWLVGSALAQDDAWMQYTDQWVGQDANGFNHPDGYGTLIMTTYNPGYMHVTVNHYAPSGQLLNEMCQYGYNNVEIDYADCHTGDYGEGEYPVEVVYSISGEEPHWGSWYLTPFALSIFDAKYFWDGAFTSTMQRYTKCIEGDCNTLGAPNDRLPPGNYPLYLSFRVFRLRVGQAIGAVEFCHPWDWAQQSSCF